MSCNIYSQNPCAEALSFLFHHSRYFLLFCVNTYTRTRARTLDAHISILFYVLIKYVLMYAQISSVPKSLAMLKIARLFGTEDIQYIYISISSICSKLNAFTNSFNELTLSFRSSISSSFSPNSSRTTAYLFSISLNSSRNSEFAKSFNDV